MAPFLYPCGFVFILLGLGIVALIAASLDSAIIVVVPMIIAAVASLVGGLLLCGVARLIVIAYAAAKSARSTADYFRAMQECQEAKLRQWRENAVIRKEFERIVGRRVSALLDSAALLALGVSR